MTALTGLEITNLNNFAQGFARELAEDVQALGFQSDVIDLKDYDPEDKLSDEVSCCGKLDPRVMNQLHNFHFSTLNKQTV